MFFLSESAVREAVRNAKRERSERGACSAADAAALSAWCAVAVGIVRVAGGVVGRQRWPCLRLERVRLSSRLAGGDGWNVCDCRAGWRGCVLLMGGYGS